MDGNKQTNKQTIPCPVESKVNIKGTHHPKTQKNCIDRMIDNPFWKVFFKKQNLGIIYPVCTYYCIRCKHTNDRIIHGFYCNQVHVDVHNRQKMRGKCKILGLVDPGSTMDKGIDWTSRCLYFYSNIWILGEHLNHDQYSGLHYHIGR